MFDATLDVFAEENGFIENYEPRMFRDIKHLTFLGNNTYGTLPMLSKKLTVRKHQVLKDFQDYLIDIHAKKTVTTYVRNFCRIMLPNMRALDRIHMEMKLDDFIDSAPLIMHLFKMIKENNVSKHVQKQMLQAVMSFIQFAKIRSPPSADSNLRRPTLEYMRDIILLITAQNGMNLDPTQLLNKLDKERDESAYSVLCTVLDDTVVRSTVVSITLTQLERTAMKTVQWNYVTGHLMANIIHKNGLRDECCYKLKRYNVFPINKRIQKRSENVTGKMEYLYVLQYYHPKQSQMDNGNLGFIVLDEDLYPLFMNYVQMVLEKFPDLAMDTTFFVTYLGKAICSSTVDYLLRNFFDHSGFPSIDPSCNVSRHFLHTEEYQARFRETLSAACGPATSVSSGHSSGTQLKKYVHPSERCYEAIMGHLELRRIRREDAVKQMEKIEETKGLIVVNLARKPRSKPTQDIAGQPEDKRKRKHDSNDSLDKRSKETISSSEIKQENESSLEFGEPSYSFHRMQLEDANIDDVEIVFCSTGPFNNNLVVKLDDSEISDPTVNDFAPIERKPIQESSFGDRQVQEWELDQLSITQELQIEALLGEESTQLESQEDIASEAETPEKSIVVPKKSKRQTAGQIKAHAKRVLFEAVRSGSNEAYLEEFEVQGKGRCIRAAKKFERGEYVLEYRGDLISLAEAKKREKKYRGNVKLGSYMYHFKHNDIPLCIDATVDNGYKGRLISHSSLAPNLITKPMTIDGKARLLFFAKTSIEIKEEVQFDYGERNVETVALNPWLVNS